MLISYIIFKFQMFLIFIEEKEKENDSHLLDVDRKSLKLLVL